LRDYCGIRGGRKFLLSPMRHALARLKGQNVAARACLCGSAAILTGLRTTYISVPSHGATEHGADLRQPSVDFTLRDAHLLSNLTPGIAFPEQIECGYHLALAFAQPLHALTSLGCRPWDDLAVPLDLRLARNDTIVLLWHRTTVTAVGVF